MRGLLEEAINYFVLLPVPVKLDEVVEVHAAGGVLAGLVDRRRHHHLLPRLACLELLHSNKQAASFGYLRRCSSTRFYIRQSNLREAVGWMMILTI